MIVSNSLGLKTPENRLVSVARPARSTNLIVYFNGYGNMAYSRAGVPFATKFEGYAKVATFDAHAIWFVEEKPSWYLDHQSTILDILGRYVVENDIKAIKFIGSSAGAYAAIRCGLLMDKIFSGQGRDVVILSFCVNPQTGFRPALLNKLKAAIVEARWPINDFGTDPILLPQFRAEALQHMTVELADLAADYKPTNFAVVLFNDELNPIERTFCDDIKHWEFVLHLPQRLRMGHGAGCITILREYFWPAFDAALPFTVAETTCAELISLT